MEEKVTTEITFLSNFSWSHPGTLELLCETASFKNFKVRHFSKPHSIFTKKNRAKANSPLLGVESQELYNFSVKLSRAPVLNNLQNMFLWKQIKSTYGKRIKKVLIYNNLDSLEGLRDKLIDHFDILIFLCADYSRLDERLKLNCNIADGIFVIPKSMYQVLLNQYPEKKLVVWPQPVTSKFNSSLQGDQKAKIDEILLNIPQPRIIYAGIGLARLNRKIFRGMMDRFPSCSFITFGGEEFLKEQNHFVIPAISKQEMLYFISQCNVGFMPYEISDPHNLHCVPLKLFDYFSAGLPVVSSKLLNISQYKELLFLCETAEEFESAIEKSLKERIESEACEKRKTVYQSHSTNKTSDAFERCIKEL